VGGAEVKKSGAKVAGAAKSSDQPVVFHRRIKSSGYGKEQPVPLLLLLPPPGFHLLLLTTIQVMRMFGNKAPQLKKKSSAGVGGMLGATQYDMQSSMPVHKQIIEGWNERDRLHR
jgi:hypothetical protein